MPAEGLDCQAQSFEGNTQHMEGAVIVQEYTLNVPRKSNVEGLEYSTFEDGT